MTRFVRWIALLLSLGASTALAQTGSISGFCDQGGTKAALSGLLATNYHQGIIPSCTVTVYVTGTQTLATLYSNGGGTPLANPFTANTASSTAPGQWTFWASNAQQYDVVLSGGIPPNTYSAPVTVVTAGGVSGSFGNYLPLSGGTLYGSLYAPNINGEVYPAQCGSASPPSWCSGTTADAWYRAACTQLPAKGGVINMLGLTGTIAASMICSTPTKQVITLEDPTQVLNISEADGGIVFPLDNGSMLLGPGAGQCNAAAGIHLTNSANVAAIVGPAHLDGTQESMNVSGLCLYGAAGASVGQGLILADRVFANTIIEGNVLGVCNTACMRVLDTGEIDLTNNWFNVEDGVTSITGIPLIIQGTGLGNGCNVGPVNVSGGQIEHALGGANYPEILVEGDGTGLVLACDIHIHDLGIERSPGGTPGTNGIVINDCKNCSVENVVATGISAGSQSLIQINSNYANSIDNVVIRNISNIFGTYTNTLDDTTPGSTLQGGLLTFLNQPFITTYYANPGYVVPPVLPLSTLQALGSDAMAGAGNFNTGSGTIGTGFVSTGCNAGVTCTYTRTNSTAPPGLTYSQEIQITANGDTSEGFNGVQYGTSFMTSFTAGQTYAGSFWAKSDGTFVGYPSFLLWNSLIPTFVCDNVSNVPMTSTWTAYSFLCTPTTTGSSNLAIAAATPPGNTGTFWLAGFSFAPVSPLASGTLLSAIGPYGIGPANPAQQTITINGAACVLGSNCTVSTSGVTSVNGNAGALVMNFSTGAGSCSYSGGTTTCTFSGSGSGGGSVSNFIANAGNWPTWLVPTVTSSTSTPTLSVAASAIPNSALANPSLTLGSTALTLGTTTTAVTGISVNGVTLNAAGSSSLFLNQAGGYTTPTSSPSGAAGGVLSGTYPNPGIATQIPVINGVVYSKGFSGTTLAERWNACISAAQGLTSGSQTAYCDASADSGTWTTDTEIEVGSSSGVAVGLILPCQIVVKGGMTDGTSAVINFWSGASVRNNCPASGLNGAATFTPTSTSNLGYVAKTTTVSGGPYISLEGFNITNIAGGHATASGIGFYLNGPQNDGSTLSFVNVNDSLDTYAVEAYNISAATTWQHSSINAQDGGTPFYAKTDASGYVQSLTLSHMTIVHAGTGLPEILCTDTRSVTPHISDLQLDHIYTETGTDGTTPQINIQGCNTVAVDHYIIKSQSSGSTAALATISNAYNTNFSAHDITFSQGSGTFTYPVNAVINNYSGETASIYTDSLGHLDHYSPPGVPSKFGSMTANSLIVTGVATSPTTSPICPNGPGGAFTIVGCTGGSGSTGFPITLGTTAIGASSTTTAIAGLTLTSTSVNGVTLNGSGSSTLFLNQAGSYVSPTASTTWPTVTGGGSNTVTTPFSTAAPWTFSAAGAASTPGLLISGTPFTGGSATTTMPQLYVNSGSAVGSFSTGGTLIGGNAPSGFTGNLMDFYVNGVVSLFSVTSGGALTTYGPVSARGANLMQTAVTTTVPLTVSNTMAATADLQDWKSNGSIVASMNNLGALTTTNIIDSAITTGTSPICANGTGGAFTTSGCTATQTICSGTISLGTSAIASGAAATTVTATCTGLASTDNIILDFNGSPLGVVGYQPSTSGTLTIVKWPTANTINVAVINNTSSSVTPGAITLNYRVTR